MASNCQRELKAGSGNEEDENLLIIVRQILDDLVAEIEEKPAIKSEENKKAAETSSQSNDETLPTRSEKRTFPDSSINEGVAAGAAATKSIKIDASDYLTSCFYSVKWIEFNGNRTPILMQNENGPCPLISICNCLMLRGHLKLEPDGLELIENDKLIQMLANLLLNEFVPRFMQQQLDRGHDIELNLEQNISDALSIFESLQYGLNVNVRFDKCTSFEYTREMDIFDLFSIALYHGWLIDPEQTEFRRYLADKSYNQLVELSITPVNATNEEQNYIKLLADSFLESTSSQLTFQGLSVLHETMRPDELAILFRNNHFSTVYKNPHTNRLYTLVTDNGYLNHKNIAWETLESIDGDGQFCNSSFKPLTSSEAAVTATAAAAHDDDRDVVCSGTNNPAQNAQCDNDYLLALSLQQNLDLEDNEEAQRSSAAESNRPRESAKGPDDVSRSSRRSVDEATGNTQSSHDRSMKANKTTKKDKPKEKEKEKEKDKCLIM